VVANYIICLDTEDIGLVVELVGMAEAVAACQYRAKVFCQNKKFIRRTVNAHVTSFDVLYAKFDFRRQPVAPVRE